MTSTVVLLGLGAVLLVTVVVVVVPRGSRQVVLRSGSVRRVAESGVAWRMPLAEHAVRVVSEPHQLPVRARATTVDGVPVLVLTEVELRLLPPQVGDRWTDPWPRAEVLAEQVLAALISTLPVAQLRYALRAAEHRLGELLGEAVESLGMEVLTVVVLEVELPLASDRGPD